METYTYKIIQKYFFISVLTIFSFSLSSLTAKESIAKTTKNSVVMENQITIKITKKTSLEELEKIKKQIAEEGFEFNYSNVVYNERKEIISISISYKDANNNSGNYSVGSHGPINNILITSSGNQISVKSEGSGNQAFINQGNGNKISDDHQKNIEERKAEMAKIRDEMDKKMADRMQSMKERGSQMRARMQNEIDSMFENRQIRSSQNFNGNYNLLTKNTTNSELLDLEKTYQSDNITFSYNQLERNSNELITHISITINNGNGSISTSSFGNGKDPIKDVSIGVDSEHTIMKSAE